MQVYYEATTIIPINHQIHIQLPDSIPVGRQAKIAIIYELEPQTSKQYKTLVDFLGAGKNYSRFASTEEIDDFVANNRDDWLCKD